jgi:hypothetical protein
MIVPGNTSNARCAAAFSHLAMPSGAFLVQLMRWNCSTPLQSILAGREEK